MNRSAHGVSATLAEHCPYCGHEITHEELAAIKARIAEDEKRKYKLQEAEIEKRHKAQLLEQTSELRKQLLAKDNEIRDRELKAEAMGAKKAQKELQVERESWLKARKTAADAQEKRDEELRRKEAALALGQKNLANDKRALDAAHKVDLANQKRVLDTHYEKQILSFKAEREKENHRYQVKLADMQRQLEKKSADELGEGAEVDIYNDLKAAFPHDVIRRVDKGTAGADIVHEVSVDGRCCGKFVYDSKNRAQWKTAYVEQLRQDQLAEKADYAILATRKFGRNIREMARHDGVIVINPARVVVIAGILRDVMETLSRARLSESGKQQKRERLYEFLSSKRCTDLFQRIEQTMNKLRLLDERELKQQRDVREDRGGLLAEVEKTVFGELRRGINTILSGSD